MKVLTTTLIIAIPILLFLYLLRVDINPSGVFKVRQTVGELSPYVDRLLPDTRVLGVTPGDDGAYQLVIGEPTYLSIHPPGAYDSLTVEMEWQNAKQPIVELGLVVNEDPLQYTLQPLQSLLIDESQWSRLNNNGVTLLQREKVYSSIEDFEANPPERSSIATFHHPLKAPYRMDAYVPAGTYASVDVSLRGYHEYLTYIKNEPLLVQATFMDMNREYGEDVVELLAVNETGEIVGGTTVEDDGEAAATAHGSSLRHAALVVSALPEGVYKVILKADRDIFFRTLTTRQQYMTFVGPMFVGDDVGYRQDSQAVSLFTDGKHLSFETYHADAVQKVQIGSDELLMPEAQVRYDHEVSDAGLVAVSAEAGDFLMMSDGKVAFTRSQFFSPDPVKLSAQTNLDDLGINFIIAEYSPPKKDGDWLKSSAVFDLSTVYGLPPADLKLVLAAPSIAALQNEIRVHAFDLIFERPALTRAQLLDKISLWIRDLF